MSTQEIKSGAFVFDRKGMVPSLSVDQLEALADKYQLDAKKVVPTYCGDKQALARAIARSHTSLRKEGIKLTRIKSRKERVVYGITTFIVNEEGEEVNHQDQPEKVIWRIEDPSKVTSRNLIVEELLNNLYSQYYEKITSTDWTQVLVSYLMEECDAFAWKDDGRVYCVPNHAVAKTEKFSDYLAEVSIYLTVVKIPEKQVEVVKEVAQESLIDKLADLKVEAEGFDGSQRPSTYSKRIEEYRKLKVKAIRYRDALEISTSLVEETLEALEKKAEEMLEMRETQVLHHDGSISSK